MIEESEAVLTNIAKVFQGKTPQGVIIKKIAAGSPAEKSGLKVGDALTAFNDTTLSGDHDLQYRLVLSKIGETGKFQVLRDGKPEIVDVELIAPPEIPKRDLRVISGRNPLSGITIANLSPALAVEIGADDSATGVIVAAVRESQIGISIGMNPGDIILEVNGIKITSTAQLETLMKRTSSKWQIAYQRGGNIQTITVQM